MFQQTKTEWNELVANCVQLSKRMKHSCQKSNELIANCDNLSDGIKFSPATLIFQKNIVFLPLQNIKRKNGFVANRKLIYEIRGQRIMLDFDLAKLYGVETKRLKEQVRRNIGRFPDDFMFEITREEYNSLRSQFATLKNENVQDPPIDGKSLRSQFATSNRGGVRYMPFAFTEQGVAMLSSVLNSELAITTNIRIMRAFVAVRQLILDPPVNKVSELQHEVKELKQYIEDVFTDYNDINEDTRLQLEQINQTLAEMQVKNRLLDKPRRKIGFFTEQQRENKEDMIE